MDALALTLALIFLPGIIWARLDAKYASQTKPSQFDLTLNAFVFGLVAYVVTYAIYSIPYVAQYANFNVSSINVDDKEMQKRLSAEIVDDIIVATFVGLIISPFWLALKRYKIITRILQSIKVTNRYGDEDVWDFTLNSTDIRTRFVNLRDERTKLTFSGYVEVFSEDPSLRELLLREVSVYDTETGEPAFQTPRIYLAREPKEMMLEFPAEDHYVWVEDRNRKGVEDGTKT